MSEWVKVVSDVVAACWCVREWLVGGVCEWVGRELVVVDSG